ncbi:interleukin-21 [Toxotes jaculatrix]|uniref:interleukin-21 n=1 Tax=Toxotes jaculatrix TaxID=941984 RepID=UPI001B3A89D4|nr:interleukin-21 [Toxotes jaculatrix]
MKLVVLCLFAVCCCSLANTTNSRKKLEEVLRQLRDVKTSLQNDDKMLNTPPENIENCCSLKALECFRANLKLHFNINEKKQSKLYRSLTHTLTVNGLDFCNSGNKTLPCQHCDSHPKAPAQEFFNRLESLIQRGITRLTMN